MLQYVRRHRRHEENEEARLSVLAEGERLEAEQVGIDLIYRESVEYV